MILTNRYPAFTMLFEELEMENWSSRLSLMLDRRQAQRKSRVKNGTVTTLAV